MRSYSRAVRQLPPSLHGSIRNVCATLAPAPSSANDVGSTQLLVSGVQPQPRYELLMGQRCDSEETAPATAARANIARPVVANPVQSRSHGLRRISVSTQRAASQRSHPASGLFFRRRWPRSVGELRWMQELIPRACCLRFCCGTESSTTGFRSRGPQRLQGLQRPTRRLRATLRARTKPPSAILILCSLKKRQAHPFDEGILRGSFHRIRG